MENEFGREIVSGNIKTYYKCKNLPNMSLFIARVL